MSEEFDLLGPLPSGRLVIDASAGTGKTYSLSALVVRHVAERGIEASELLVVTFTRAAAAELRDPPDVSSSSHLPRSTAAGCPPVIHGCRFSSTLMRLKRRGVVNV